MCGQLQGQEQDPLPGNLRLLTSTDASGLGYCRLYANNPGHPAWDQLSGSALHDVQCTSECTTTWLVEHYAHVLGRPRSEASGGAEMVAFAQGDQWGLVRKCTTVGPRSIPTQSGWLQERTVQRHESWNK
nr:hypothetical protein CFP56_46752 [Quercus suber]